MYIKRSEIIEEDNDQVHLSDEDLSRFLHTIGQLAMYMAIMFMTYGVYLAFTLLAIYVLL
jgi:glucokinase